MRRNADDRCTAKEIQELCLEGVRHIACQVEEHVAGQEDRRLIRADNQAFSQLAAGEHIAADKGVHDRNVRHGARGVGRCREGNVRKILNTDTAVRGRRLGEGDFHASIARVADFGAGRARIARVIEEQGQVDFCRGGEGDAAQDVQKTGLKVVASIHSLVTPFRCSDRDVLDVARRDVAQDDHARRFRSALIRDLVAPVLKRCGDRRAVRERLGDKVKLEFAPRFEVVVLDLCGVIELGNIILVRLVPKAEPSLLAEGVDDLAELSFCDLACQRAGHAQGALFPVFRAEVVSARAARNGDLTSSLWRKQVVVSNHHQTPVVYAVISAEAKAIAGHVGASPLLRISRAVSAPICLPTRRASSSEPSPL